MKIVKKIVVVFTIFLVSTTYAQDKDIIVAVAVADNYSYYEEAPYASYHTGYKMSQGKTTYEEVVASAKEKVNELFKDPRKKHIRFFLTVVII